MSNDAKVRILARRARFVAAAVASMSLSAVGCSSEAKACLEPAIDASDAADVPTAEACLAPPRPDTSADAEPETCLAPPPPDTGTDAGGG